MNVEQIAAKTLLNRGIKVPVTAPLWLRAFGKRTINVVITPPHYGTLHRIGLLFLSMDITEEKLEKIDEVNSHTLFLAHGKSVCKIAAYAILNGKWSGRLFAGMLSRYLYWKLTPINGFTIARVMVMLCGTSAFPNTIRLVSSMKMTLPTLSHETEGS
jgi:hypothetical protein